MNKNVYGSSNGVNYSSISPIIETEFYFSDDLMYMASNQTLKKLNISTNSYNTILSSTGTNRRILTKDKAIMLISESNLSGQIVIKIEAGLDESGTYQ
jgi:hypothetical protein